MKALTTKGHQVFALQRFLNPQTQAPEWSGKIRMVAGNPYFDEYFKWYRDPERDGKAIDHDMGDLTGEVY